MFPENQPNLRHNSPRLLTAQNAWRIIMDRTGFSISRSAFYRWLQEGNLMRLKAGHRVYVPWSVVEGALANLNKTGDLF